jgi:hypothetical protein
MHDFELNFHLHPEVSTLERDSWWHLQKVESRISMTLLGEGRFRSVCGQEEPISGWYSPAYGVRQKCTTLQFSKNGLPEHASIVTAICFDGQIPQKELEKLAATL